MSSNSSEILCPVFEDGLDVQFTEYGQLVICMNTPQGRVVQRLTFHPFVALKLTEWLLRQDWQNIRANAINVDASLAELWPLSQATQGAATQPEAGMEKP